MSTHDNSPAALAGADELVFVGPDCQPFTTSVAVAGGTGVQHKNLVELIRANLADLNDVGRVAFETRPFETAGGTQRRDVALLDEPAAALLITYMRNNEIVRAFKKRLIADFYAMRARLAQPVAPTGTELLALAVLEAEQMLNQKDEQIAELEPRAAVADKILDATGDLSVRDAAQSLTRAGIKVGQNRLFAVLDKQCRWISRAAGDGRYRVMQSAIEAGWMSVIPQSHYHPKTGVLVLDPPQPRVTPKGLQRLLADFGAVAQ